MRIEYLFADDKYKNHLKKIDFDGKNGFTIKKRNNNKQYKNYFLLTLELDEKNTNEKLYQVEDLLEIKEKCDQQFISNKISYVTLKNEASEILLRELYPHFLKFEMLLRKFLKSVFFEIQKDVDHNLISTIEKDHDKFKNFEKKSILDKDSYFDDLNLGEIYKFLFCCEKLIKSISDYIKNESSIKFTKEDFLNLINNNSSLTIWEYIFDKDFSDSILKENFLELKEYRNDVMHFHSIDFNTYKKALECVEKVNKDLEKQIQKRIISESKEEKVNAVKTTEYYKTKFYDNLFGDLDIKLPKYISDEYWHKIKPNYFIENSYFEEFEKNINKILDSIDISTLQNDTNKVLSEINLPKFKTPNCIKIKKTNVLNINENSNDNEAA